MIKVSTNWLGSKGSLIGRSIGSSFAPTDISGNILWLRADLGVTKNVSDQVSSWADQSGSGNHFTHGVDAEKPVYTAAAVNGQPSLRFTGASNHRLDAASNIMPGTTKNTVFMVCKQAATPSDGCLYTTVNGANGDVARYLNSAGAKIRFYSIGGATQDAAITSDTNFHYFTWTINATIAVADTLNVRENAISILTSASGTRAGTPDRNMRLGLEGTNIRPLSGDIAEFIIYNTALSGANISTVESYLATRYAL